MSNPTKDDLAEREKTDAPDLDDLLAEVGALAEYRVTPVRGKRGALLGVQFAYKVAGSRWRGGDFKTLAEALASALRDLRKDKA